MNTAKPGPVLPSLRPAPQQQPQQTQSQQDRPSPVQTGHRDDGGPFTPRDETVTFLPDYRTTSTCSTGVDPTGCIIDGYGFILISYDGGTAIGTTEPQPYLSVGRVVKVNGTAYVVAGHDVRDDWDYGYSSRLSDVVFLYRHDGVVERYQLHAV